MNAYVRERRESEGPEGFTVGNVSDSVQFKALVGHGIGDEPQSIETLVLHVEATHEDYRPIATNGQIDLGGKQGVRHGIRDVTDAATGSRGIHKNVALLAG